MKNYLVYPSDFLNISQSYTGKYSHAKNYMGQPNDYPFDECGKDTGRGYMICPCDEMVVRRIYGVKNSGTNTIWLESSSPVVLANGSTEIITMLVIHPNDDDLSKITKGQKFKRGDLMFREGTDGNATGNHFHISIGTGRIKGNGWVQNSKGAWVLYTTGKNIKPEEAFFINKEKTKIISPSGIDFKFLPDGALDVKPPINVVTPPKEPVKPPIVVENAIVVGSKVKIKSGALTYDKKRLSTWVYFEKFDVTEVKGDRIVIARNRVTIAAMHKKDLYLCK